jgi:hypothetical protein
MSTSDLSWTNVIMATTELHATGQNLRRETLQWHSEGSVLYIVMENRAEVDLRLDLEILEIQVCVLLLQQCP